MGYRSVVDCIHGECTAPTAQLHGDQTGLGVGDASVHSMPKGVHRPHEVDSIKPHFRDNEDAETPSLSIASTKIRLAYRPD